MRVLVADGCGLSAAEYDLLTQDFLRDVFERKVHAVRCLRLNKQRAGTVADEAGHQDWSCVGP